MPKGIRIPVHGFVELTDLELDLLDTPWMQRLRRIRQLALTDYVYPGATHTRFEHSIGVLHVVDRMFNSIFNPVKKNEVFLKDFLEEEEDFEEKKKYWRTVLRLAALLHDVGHSPFSHGGEEVLPEKPKETWKKDDKPEYYKHEDYTSEIIKNKLSKLIDNDDLNKTFGINSKLIAAIFSDAINLPPDIRRWRSLISSQLDADRCDYLLRDSLHLGVSYGLYDLERIIESITLGKKEEATDEYVIAIDEGGRQAVEGFLIARYMMFMQVYFHRTRRAFDKALTDAFNEIGVTYPNLNKLDDLLNWDDCFVMEKIKLKKNRKKDACRSILERDHLRWVHDTSQIEREGTEEGELRGMNVDLIKNHIDTDVLTGAKKKLWKDCEEKLWRFYVGTSKEPIYIAGRYEDDKRRSVRIDRHSPILGGLHSVRILRLYSKKEDKPAVQEAIKRLKERSSDGSKG
ncbi:HD domain-containing protein [bacterium]|nr:HD domain-containing protein [bacterium]